MANLVGTTVAENYLKARETTTMGTRDLAFFQVDMGTDVETNYTNSDSLFAKAIRGLQQRVELYAIGTPNGNWFTVVASSTTAPMGEGQVAQDGDRVSDIESAINDAAGVDCAVWNALLNGSNLENNC